MLNRKFTIFETEYTLYDLIKILLFVISILVSFCFWSVVTNAVFFNRPASGAERVDCMAALCAGVPLVISFGQLFLRRESSFSTWGICTLISGTFTALCCLIFFSLGGMEMTFGTMLFILLCSLAGCAAFAGLFAGLRRVFRAVRNYVTDDSGPSRKKSDVLKLINMK